MKLLVGSKNAHKSAEIRRMLAGFDLDVVDLSRFPRIPDVVEDADTLEGNAVKKACFFAGETGLLTISDDSGLEVDALDGRPGVYSARYAGENVTYEDNNRLMLEELKGVPAEKRTARFRTVAALASPEGCIFTCEGAVEGIITEKPRGGNGFGYDPIFYSPELSMTFAEADPAVKDSISHRARALSEFRRLFAEYLEGQE